MVTPIVGGALVDQYGSKIVLGCGVALWSVSTFLTPWAAESSLFALLALRVLLGMAEGVALPSMNKMILRYESLYFSCLGFIIGRPIHVLDFGFC